MTAIPRPSSRPFLLSLACLCLSLLGGVWLTPARGLQAEYFTGDPAGSRPAFTVIDPAPTTAQVAWRWSSAAPARFYVRWFGYLAVPRGGRYTFTLVSDDGSTLAIDGRSVVDHSGAHGAEPKSGAIDLTAGSHAVLIELTQQGGPYAVDVQWAREGGRPGALPLWALTPEKAAPWRVFAGRVCDLMAVASIAALFLLAAWRLRSAGWTPLNHPRASTLALFVLLACVHTWPIASDPGRLTRHDNRDTILNEWIVSWVAHQAVSSPLHLYDGNIFYPESRTLAYSEPMIVQAALGAPLLWLGASPVLVYNLLLISGFALSGWAMTIVVARWTGLWSAGLVSGTTFAFCAHTLTRIPHLQAQHVEFLPLSLLALDTLLRRPTVGAGARLATWCVLQALTSVYLLAITVFVMVAALAARYGEWWRDAKALKALAVTAAVAAALLFPFLLPYYRVSHDQGLSRSLADAAQFSASWLDYLTTPSRIHAAIWSAGIRGGTGLFPGALALLLTGVTVIRGVAFRDRRARMFVVIGVVGFYLSFGPAMPGYGALYAAFPLLQAIRATARFGYMVTVAVAVLAGFGAASIGRMVPARAQLSVAVLLVCLATLEPLAAPLGLSRFDGIPPVFDRLPRRDGVVAVELPFPGPRSAQFHAHAMLNSTRHWQPIVNGYSGFQPASFYRHAEAFQQFPGDAAVAMMRELGVTHVFVHTASYSGEDLRRLASRQELTRIDAFGETELYELK